MFFWAGQEGGSGSRGGALPRRPIGSRALAGEPRRIASGPPRWRGNPTGVQAPPSSPRRSRKARGWLQVWAETGCLRIVRSLSGRARRGSPR